MQKGEKIHLNIRHDFPIFLYTYLKLYGNFINNAMFVYFLTLDIKV